MIFGDFGGTPRRFRANEFGRCFTGREPLIKRARVDAVYLEPAYFVRPHQVQV
jgi:hypothetical protein